MPKIIQVIDVDSLGHKVRLDDGRVMFLHYTGRDISIGSDVEDAVCTTPATIAPSVEFLNSPEQVQANILSEVVLQHGESDASSEPSAAPGNGDCGTLAVQAEPEK